MFVGKDEKKQKEARDGTMFFLKKNLKDIDGYLF